MALDAFIKIENIPGESTDEAHADWMEILSYHHGVSQRGTGSFSSGGGPASERCDHEQFTFRKNIDKASPKLNLMCCKGLDVGEVNLEVCRATGAKTPYLKVKMEDAMITSVRHGATSNGQESLPVEEVSLSYRKIWWTYTETDHRSGEAKGDVEHHWDLELNTGE